MTVERLRRLRVALEAGRPVPDDVASWLLDALAQFERGNGSLCRALGLRGPGQPTMATRENRRLRDLYISVAASCCHGGDPHATAWACAGRLAERVARFECRVLPRIIDARHPPPELHEADRYLFLASRYGRLLRSQRRIYAAMLRHDY